jgi:hypothetical protein
VRRRWCQRKRLLLLLLLRRVAARGATARRVSREGLLAFAAAHGARSYDVQRRGDAAPRPLAFGALTTAEVMEAVIKLDETQRTGGTYAALLLAQARARGDCTRVRAAAADPLRPIYPCCDAAEQGACDAAGVPHVGAATRFVSHAWAYPFTELVEALRHHLAADAGCGGADDRALTTYL